jgi:hypothetical protein
MIFTKDNVLNECQPSGMDWTDYLKDCELIINSPDVHSDEWSTEDEALANNERNDNKRPDRIKETNSVIKIYDKEWRSTRVRKVLMLFFKKRNL